MKKNTLLGLLLVVIGVWLFVFQNTDSGYRYFSENLLATGFLFIGGVFLMSWYSSRNDHKNNFALVPATFFITIGLLYMTLNFISYFTDIDALWPYTLFLYPGSIALGFRFAWLASAKGSKLFYFFTILFAIFTIIQFILTTCVLFLVTLFSADGGELFWPLSFIMTGFIIIFITTLLSFNNKEIKDITGKSEKEWEVWGKKLGENIEKFFKNIDKK